MNHPDENVVNLTQVLYCNVPECTILIQFCGDFLTRKILRTFELHCPFAYDLKSGPGGNSCSGFCFCVSL